MRGAAVNSVTAGPLTRNSRSVANSGRSAAALIVVILALLGIVGLSPRPSAAPANGPPTDPRLAQVYAIIEANCAGCHQAGKLKVPAAGGALANILALDEIAAEPHLIRRGVADASRLYHVLLDRHRPLELPADAPWPNAAEIQRIRTFIDELSPEVHSCPAREKPIGPDRVAATIDAAVKAAGEASGRELRFITLTHLANACASEAEFESYREAIGKTLNSLSWGLLPIVPQRADADGNVLMFKLSDIGWIPDHWEALAVAEPAGIALDLTAKLTVPGADTRPIRGDWFITAALKSPLYDELLGLPPTLEEAVRLLGINRDGDAGTPRALRAGLRQSAITRGPRVIERFHAEARRLWLAYDFIDGTGERDIFDRPLGFVRSAPERHRFRADGIRAILSLPNGYLAFAAFDPDGRKLAEVPANIETPAARWPGNGTPAACASCHSAGLVPFSDAVRGHVSSEKFTGPKEVRDAALSIYPAAADWSEPFDDDSFRFRRALIQSGVDPDRTLHGLELSAALARRYRLDVTFAGLAAESGLSADGLVKALEVARPHLEPHQIVRLKQGLIARSEANALLAMLKSGIRAPVRAASSDAMRLSVWTDRTRYRPGDIVTIHAESNAACHLTLIGIDPAGKATVLFPSEFEPENLLEAGKPITVPAAGSQYQFRLRERGAETIVGLCQPGAKFPSGVEPDYERQRFTVLGNYENFERAAFQANAQALRAPRAQDRRPARGTGARETRPDPRPDGKLDVQLRAAVRITIE